METLASLLEAQRQRTERRAASLDATRTAASSGAAGPETPRAARGIEECPLCEGARFVRVTADPDHPDFGRPVPCECVRREDDRSRYQRLLRYSRLGALSRMTFATLLRRGRSDRAVAQERYEHAVAIAERYAESPEGWLVITGVPGCGKTHLAAAIAHRAIERGRAAVFLPVADLLDELRGSYDEDAEIGYQPLLDQLRNAPLVVLDDLDSYARTDWAREKFAQVISHRFYQALPTVFTCERPPTEIDARLGSRLTDPTLSQVLMLQEESAPSFFEVGAMKIERLRRYTFDSFEPGGRGLRGKFRENLEGAYRLARSWADDPRGWLVLTGGNGCGKTHLAAAIANYRLDRGDSVGFANVPDLFDQLRATFGTGASERYDVVFQRLLDSPLLILDDLGAQQASPWAKEKLYQLLNHRHLAALPTVITTNLEPRELEPRIASRMADLDLSIVYEVSAPDYRIGAM